MELNVPACGALPGCNHYINFHTSPSPAHPSAEAGQDHERGDEDQCGPDASPGPDAAAVVVRKPADQALAAHDVADLHGWHTNDLGREGRDVWEQQVQVHA